MSNLFICGLIALLITLIFKGLGLFNKFANNLNFQVFGELINHVDTKEKVVALTYDDGPNPPFTNQLLEILEENQVKATFFVIGKKFEQYPQIVRLILSKGHWDLDSKDYNTLSYEVIESYVLEHVHPGSIILMHDGGGERSQTLIATERLLQKLQKNGYKFKTVSELLR